MELGVERESSTRRGLFIEDLGRPTASTSSKLVREFEKGFTIRHPDEDARSLRTVGDRISLS